MRGDLFILPALFIAVLVVLGIPLAIWWFSLWRIRHRGAQTQYEIRGPGLWLAHWMRTSRATAVPFRVLSSHVLPTAFAIALTAGGIYGLNRAVFAFAQSGGFICQNGGGALPNEGASIELAADTLCASSEVYLAAKTTYHLEVAEESKWTDAGAEVSAFGIPFSWRKIWQLPLRRNLTNPWFAIIARVGDIGDEEYVLTGRSNYITPKKSGRLYLFVNEAIIGVPDYDWFYKDNAGTVRIYVNRVSPRP